MNIKVPLFCKILKAGVTSERLNPLMLPNVYLQTGFLRVGCGTHWAAVRLNLLMIHQMSLQMSFGDKGVVAPRVLALVRPVVSLKYMNFKNISLHVTSYES